MVASHKFEPIYIYDIPLHMGEGSAFLKHSMRKQFFERLIKLSGLPWKCGTEYADALSPVFLFSKLDKMFLGYFDPENVLLDNENKLFFG